MARTKKEPQEEKKADLKSLIAEFKSKDIDIKFANEIKQEPKLKTGIFALDYVLDGGISQCEGGYRIEFFGKESSAKTSFFLKLVATFQALGKKCMYIDGEGSFDVGWASILGVDTSKLVIVHPDSLEQAGDVAVSACENFDLIGIDSLPSLVPVKELEGSLEDQTMGSHARVLAQMTRVLTRELKGRFTTIVCINQLREKIGGYGNPEITPGGRAIKHFYNARVQFKPSEYIETGTKEDKERIGFVSSLTCVKNKKGKPYRNTAVDFYYDGFIDNRKSLLYFAIKYGIISQAGPYYSYKEIKKQGADNFVKEVTDDVWNKIEEEIWERLK